MTGPVQEVDIPALVAVAGSVDQSASLLGKAHADHEARLATAALTGWDCGAALSTAVGGWSRFLTDLRDQVATFGEGLKTSAQEFQAADQAAADRTADAYGRRR